MVRGGPQEIPRPPSAEPGRPAPWAQLDEALRRPSLADVRAALAAADPARPVELRAQEGRVSAVLAALYDEPETDAGDSSLAHVVLTRRAQHLRSHRGEVSFPGGRQEPGETHWETALREAHEEIALDPGAVREIGQLDHLRTVTSESFIVPFVAELGGRPELVPDPGEVELVLHVPLAELLADDVFHEELWTIGGQQRPIFFFDLVGDTIWGATAAMLRNLLAIVTGTFDPGDRPTPWGPFGAR